jgi:hypothetical protein
MIVEFDTKQFSALVRGIRASGPAGKEAVRTTMRESAEIVKAEAADRASYSKRIPGSLKARATATNFKVSAGGEAAPNAAPIENKGKGFIRHPVFLTYDQAHSGDDAYKGRWTEKNSHPAFLHAALEVKEEEIVELIADRLTEAVAKAMGAL